jgi:hypothetical protein
MARKKALVSTFLHLELHMKDTLKVECSGDMVHLIGKTNEAIEAVGKQA